MNTIMRFFNRILVGSLGRGFVHLWNKWASPALLIKLEWAYWNSQCRPNGPALFLKFGWASWNKLRINNYTSVSMDTL